MILYVLFSYIVANKLSLSLSAAFTVRSQVNFAQYNIMLYNMEIVS